MAEIFHECRSAGRVFTQKEWGDYCDMTRHDEAKELRTQIGKYTFNVFDICLNPEMMSLVVDGKSYGYYVMIKWAECGNGIWSSAIDYSCGTGGGGSGVSYTDRLVGEKYDHRAGYRSEVDAKVAACDKALTILNGYTSNDETKKKRLIKMVEDYKRSIKPRYVQLELF